MIINKRCINPDCHKFYEWNIGRADTIYNALCPVCKSQLSHIALYSDKSYKKVKQELINKALKIIKASYSKMENRIEKEVLQKLADRFTKELHSL